MRSADPTGVKSARDVVAPSQVHHGFAVRTTAATGVHDASSRSHAVLRVYVSGSGGGGEEAAAGGAAASGRSGGDEAEDEGVLTLVDLAGSEPGPSTRRI